MFRLQEELLATSDKDRLNDICTHTKQDEQEGDEAVTSVDNGEGIKKHRKYDVWVITRILGHDQNNAAL
jgi:hypothetical protein